MKKAACRAAARNGGMFARLRFSPGENAGFVIQSRSNKPAPGDRRGSCANDSVALKILFSISFIKLLVDPLYQIRHQTRNRFGFRRHINDFLGAAVANDVLSIAIRCRPGLPRHHQTMKPSQLPFSQWPSGSGKPLHFFQGAVMMAHFQFIAFLSRKTRPGNGLFHLRLCEPIALDLR